MIFDDLLARADEVVLQSLLGKSAVRLIHAMEPGLVAPEKLERVLVELKTREGLLLDKKSRYCLIDLLREHEAQSLVNSLGYQLGSDEDVFYFLKKLSFRRGSERESLFFSFFELSPPLIERPDGYPASESLDGSYMLFPHQRRAAKEVRMKLLVPPNRVLLHMPTGSGKTRTAMNVIADHFRNQEPTVVIWLAHSEELCEQALEEFKKAWTLLGNRDIPVYRFWANYSFEINDLSEGFIVAGLSKLYNAFIKDIRLSVNLSHHISLVIIDEAHQAIADTYKLILESLILQSDDVGLLGLTATPGRTWSDTHANQSLASFFARQKVELEVENYESPIDYLVEQQYLAKVTYRSLFYENGSNISERDLELVKEGLDIPQRVLEKLGESEQRNLLLIYELENLTKLHKRIIVFASSVSHSNLIASTLRIRGISAYSVTGKTQAVERQRIIESYKSDSDDTKIICNYGVLTTGFNAPKTSAAVIARPTKSLVLYSQMVGRATRGLKAGGNTNAEIVTVVDSELPGFAAMTDAFRFWENVW